MIALRGPDLDPHIYQESYFRLWPSVHWMRDLETFIRNIFSSLSKVCWEAAGRFHVPAAEGKEILRPGIWNLSSTDESSSSKEINSSLSGWKQFGLNCLIIAITPCWNFKPTRGAKKANTVCHCLYMPAARPPPFLRDTKFSVSLFFSFLKLILPSIQSLAILGSLAMNPAHHSLV